MGLLHRTHTSRPATLAAENAALTRLHELSIRLVSQDGLTTLLDAVVDAALELAGARMGTVQILDAASGELRLIAHRGFEQAFLDHFAVVDDGTAAPCQMARRERRRVVVEDVSESAIFVGTPALPVLDAAGVRSIQSTPLVARDGTLLGIFSTHWSAPHCPSEGTLRVLDLLAREASSLIEHRRREEAMREADRHKNEFLAVLSHELRNPLAAIQSVNFFRRRRTSRRQSQRRHAVRGSLAPEGCPAGQPSLSNWTTLLVQLHDLAVAVRRDPRKWGPRPWHAGCSMAAPVGPHLTRSQ